MAKKKTAEPKQAGALVGEAIVTTKEKLKARKEGGKNFEEYYDFCITIDGKKHFFNQSDLKKLK